MIVGWWVPTNSVSAHDRRRGAVEDDLGVPVRMSPEIF